MARYYVDADKVIEHIRQYKNSNKKTFQQGINFAIKAACRALSDNRIVPRADVAEVKHGEWIIKTDEYDCEYMMCSVCKEEFYPSDADTVDTTPNYCPNCGAKMDGGAENG